MGQGEDYWELFKGKSGLVGLCQAWVRTIGNSLRANRGFVLFHLSSLTLLNSI